jgi:TonB family protein
MYLDFEDYHPDAPRVAQVISRREGALLSLVVHLVLLIVYLLLPEGFLNDRGAPPVPLPDLAQAEQPTFVYMEPLVERVVPPPPDANLSDLDRRRSTVDRAPAPTDPDPFSRGNTPERVFGTPDERLAGPEGPVAPPQPDRTAAEFKPAPSVDPGILPVSPPTTASGGDLGESLRDLRQYLSNQTYDNRQGGLSTPQGYQDIQFDSKGADFGPWVRRFLNQVRRNWYVPGAARILSGRVSIQFNVWRNGRVTDLQIVRPSDVDPFNSSAFNALVLSDPTLPLPTEYPDEKIAITITFHYNEGRGR